jgi:alpha-tubulin suppressor-like RCC1 family protein
VQVGKATDWASVATGYGASLAIKRDGSLWAWGANSLGLYGNGTTASSYVPTRIGSNGGWQLVTLRWYSVLATRSDGSLWAWGENGSGELGNGDVVYRSTPFPIP